MESSHEERPRVGFARRMLPAVLAVVALGATATGAHFYFKLRTEQLSRTLQYIEMQNTILHQRQESLYGQLQEGDKHIQEAEAALLKRVREHEAKLVEQVRTQEGKLLQRVEEHEATLAKRVEDYEHSLAARVQKHEAALAESVQHLSGQVDSFGSTIAVIDAEHKRLRSAHTTIEEEVRKYHAQVDASLAQLMDDANRLVFEPEKHCAVLGPLGLKVYPIVQRTEDDISQARKKGSKTMHQISYFVHDDFFGASASLAEVLIYLSHAAERSATSRGKVVVHPARAYARADELARAKDADNFIASFLSAVRRGPLPHSGRAPDFIQQLVLTFNNRAYTSFLTEGSGDPVLSFLSYVEEPMEFRGSTRQVSLAYEALAVVGAETFCPIHRDAARATFTRLFDVINAQKALGLGHYKNFGGDSFAERAASLATLSRMELADVAAKTLQTYKTK